MESFDTNVVVRLTVQDDEDQCRRAEDAWRKAATSGGVFLATLVLVEVSWLLRVAYKMDRKTIAGVLARLARSEGVTLEDEAVINRAIEDYEVGAADFSDYVILSAARKAAALPLHTFDANLARDSDAKLIA